ncbi:DUF4397 domain-containing protein [Terrimonas alba]|uniref:DUF4397 domain-containing protein n=1 Tax=Terrimonas alba TaxID=3349636 RepID=UPI0035F3A016
MKSSFLSFKPGVASVSGILLIVITLTACTKFNDSDNSGTPVAGLMAFNLAPDKSGIGIALSNNNLINSPLTYTNYTGTYQRVYTGTRTVESFDATSDSTLATVDYTFEPNKFYSLFLVGTNGSYKNVLVNDKFDSLSNTSGKAYVRYVNAIPDSTSPKVTITAGGVSLIDGNASFTNVSDFIPATPGEINIAVKNETTINSNRTIPVEQGKVYTVLLVGMPGATDSTKGVQIKYITNGSLTNGQ